MKETHKKKNYLDRQKVRNLQSNSFSISSNLSWKVKERKKNPFLPAGYSENMTWSQAIGSCLRLDGSITRICKKSVMPLPIMVQQQRINHWPFGMYDTIIHPLNLPVGGVPQLISALLLMFWNRKCFCRRRGSIPHSSFVEAGFAPLYWRFPAA